MATITENERKALIAAIEVNTTVATAAEDDFFSFFYPKEVVQATEFNKHQVAGLLASLEKKGLVSEEESKNTQESNTEWAVTWDAIVLLRGAA